jgi:hypothetical protein
MSLLPLCFLDWYKSTNSEAETFPDYISLARKKAGVREHGPLSKIGFKASDLLYLGGTLKGGGGGGGGKLLDVTLF